MPAESTDASSQPSQVRFTLHAIDIEVLASTLRAVAKGFFILYVVVLLKQLIPFRLGNLAWIQGFVSASIYNAAIPLGGFGFLLLAALIAPTRPTVQLLLKASRFALPAAIGFLLLIPTQAYLTLQAMQRNESTVVQQVGQVQAGLRTLRDRIELVRNSEDLAEAVAGLPKPVAQRAVALPLPQAKQELLEGIDREASTLRSRLQAQRNGLRWGASKEMVSTLVLSLVLARILACGRRNRIKEVFISQVPL